ncbi:HNH endonuclease signature motif containing protein [soil metagenome]
MNSLLDTITAATRGLPDVEDSRSAVAGLADADLVELQRSLSQLRWATDALLGLTAGEVKGRSSREHGYSGLAQTQGFRSAEEFVQAVTGSTRTEAAKLVRVGVGLVDAAPDEWHSPLGVALSAGSLSIDAADAIRRGLGEPDEAVGPSDLTRAVHQLIAAALTLNADQLYKRARDLRDEIDERGIADREKARHDQRYVRVHRRPDGMIGGSFLLGPEDGELVLGAFDHLLSPRRGGPRFTDPEEAAAAERLVADPRSNDQLAADALVAMVRLAIDADPGTLFGKHRPAVRVIVTESSLQHRGHGYLEGSNEPVSFETVERYLCDTGVLGVRHENGQPLSLGRKRRNFTAAQRIALAARDGGCIVGGCDRPPSQCEAHHIDEWEQDLGKTDVCDGVLLCRFHHMFLHNNKLRIRRKGDRYWIESRLGGEVPPIELRSKSLAWKEAARELARVL